jgi:hypothetical protein
LAVGVTGGQIVANDPQGAATQFSYGAAGAGAGLGVKVKVKLPILNSIPPPANIAGNLTSSPSRGMFFLTPNMNCREAAPADMKGTCAILECSAGYYGGGAVTLVFMGCRPTNNWTFPVAVAAAVAPFSWPVGPAAILFEHLLFTAKVVLFMATINAVPQVGGGALGYLGYLA